MILHIPLKQGCKALLYNNITQDFVAAVTSRTPGLKLPGDAIALMRLVLKVAGDRHLTKPEIAETARLAKISVKKAKNWFHNTRNRR